MKTTLSILVLLIVAAPAVAGSPAVPPPNVDPMAQLDEPSNQGVPSTAWAWALSDHESMLGAVVPQSDASATAACSAETRCADGTVISCTGNDFCWSERHCFVYCDGYTTYCNNPCP